MVVIGSEENIANRRRLYSCLFIFYVSHFQYTDVYKCISQNMHGYLLAFYGYSLVFLQISGMPRICQVDDAFGVAGGSGHFALIQCWCTVTIFYIPSSTIVTCKSL
jgi:hypothetical protein